MSYFAMHGNPLQAADLVVDALVMDERIWVPQAPNVWFRPLMFNVSNGYWINLLRVRRSGVLNRHLHPAPVFGYVIKGSWRYLEHAWVAREGAFVFEPPGEVHTLVVDGEADEMVTLFHVQGALIYMDQSGHQIGYDDVHTKIRMAQRHYAAAGLGSEYVQQFVR
jgi:quercetin dioxygenase-like cupin family protein